MPKKLITIEYFTDMLCVWAWVAQPRINELKQQWGNDLSIHYRYMDVFGDVNHHMKARWATRGGLSAFSEHVRLTVKKFPELSANKELWQKNSPRTSANSHLILKALQAIHGSAAAEEMAYKIRRAFFIDNLDISQLNTLFALVEKAGFDTLEIKNAIEDGSALADLMQDYQRARELNLKGSPSYVMNEERQILYGNVGYRVLHANVEELMRSPQNEASWC